MQSPNVWLTAEVPGSCQHSTKSSVEAGPLESSDSADSTELGPAETSYSLSLHAWRRAGATSLSLHVPSNGADDGSLTSKAGPYLFRDQVQNERRGPNSHSGGRAVLEI